MKIDERRRKRAFKMGLRVFRFSSVSSTQDKAKELLQKGVETPFLVIAEEQKEGRGRRGRRWVSEKGGLYLTYVLKVKGVEPFTYVFACCLACREALRKLGVECSIRWPNDIYFGEEKLAGILAEAEGTGEKVEYILLGVGLNVNNDVSKVDAPYLVTSVARITRKEVSLRKVENYLLISLRRYLLMNQSEILSRYERAVSIKGRKVKIETAGGIIEGVAVGIDGEGFLIVDDQGKRRRVLEGDLLQIG